MPLVSVIIPVYNSHEHLQEAIDSVLNQTFRDLEIIIIDDGSDNPATLDFLKTLAPPLRVLYKENGGPATARNLGIRESTGDFIVALDSDDKFERTFIEKSLKILEAQPAVGVVSCYVKEFGKTSKVWKTRAYDDFSFLVENRIVACCTYRRQCWTDVNGFDESMSLGLEDWDFWIRVTQKGWKVFVIPEPLFFYRKKDASLMVDKTHPNMSQILDYMLQKHQQWFLQGLKKGIMEKTLLNKTTLTLKRILGLAKEKINSKF